MADTQLEKKVLDTEINKKLANRWLSINGIRKPRTYDPNETQPRSPQSNELVEEATKLFLDRDNLVELIKDKKLSTKNESSSLDVKLTAIKDGHARSLNTDLKNEDITSISTKAEQKIKDIESRLDGIFKIPNVYEAFVKDLTKRIATARSAKEVIALNEISDQIDIQTSKIARKLQVEKRSPNTLELEAIENGEKIKQATKERESKILESIDVRLQLRVEELLRYRKEMKNNHFAETPSRKKQISKLTKLWSEDKKVLITGATGTGKTELVKSASKKMFNTKPFIITGHRDMTPFELLGKTGMKVQNGSGGDVYRPSQLIQAMNAREGLGAPFLYDEFNASPTDANIALKTLLNDGAGDEVRIQLDSDSKIKIGPDYSFTATANVKSAKHQTRFDVDPAIVRVLEPMIVDYMPAEEVYDLALASLIDNIGRLPMTREEAEVTLKNLCDAAQWTQNAYLGKKIIKDPQKKTFMEARGGASTGKAASLREAILDPGRVLLLLKGWQSARLQGESFQSYIDTQLVNFINNENYTEEDRYYLVEIFAIKGFFKSNNIDSKSFQISDLKQEVFDGWRGESETDSEELISDRNEYLSPSELARLDPYGRFKGSLEDIAKDLLKGNTNEAVPNKERKSKNIKSEKILNLQKSVGDITKDDNGLDIHKIYIEKLAEVAVKAKKLDETLEALNEIDNYVERGIFADSTRSDNIRDHILSRLSDTRVTIMNNEKDIDVMKKMLGDISKETGKGAHKWFIDKIFSIGGSSSQLPEIENTMKILENYTKNGFYDQDEPPPAWSSTGTPSLRKYAKEKELSLRKRYLEKS